MSIGLYSVRHLMNEMEPTISEKNMGTLSAVVDPMLPPLPQMVGVMSSVAKFMNPTLNGGEKCANYFFRGL